MIDKNIQFIKKKIHESCVKTGRNEEDLTLIAVTKYSKLEEIEEAYQLGIRDFGENRLQDALPKIKAMPNDCTWHFLGRIQSNKINKIIENFSLIHSVSCLKLAEQISQHAAKLNKNCSILLQVNTSLEDSKAGDSVEIWRSHLKGLFDLPYLNVLGLMTMAPLTQDENVLRETFLKLALFLKEIQRDYPQFENIKILSMGMSNDYPLAIQEGATHLRIGTALFKN